MNDPYGYSQSGPTSSIQLPALDFPETLKLQAGFARKGFQESLRLGVAWNKLSTDRIVRASLDKNSLIQGVVLVSALYKPVLKRAFIHTGQNSYASDVFEVLFNMFYLYPITGASMYYCGLIDLNKEETDRLSVSTAPSRSPVTVRELAIKQVPRLLILANYFVFVYAFKFIPYLAHPIAIAYASVVNSYYVFEPHWVKQGWSVQDRIKAVQTQWMYFMGFGFLLTFVSWWAPSPFVNLSLFSLFFPFFQLIADQAQPLPIDPYLPTKSASPDFIPTSKQPLGSSDSGFDTETSRGRAGSSKFPVTLPVLFFADTLISLLATHTSFPSQKKKKDTYAAPTWTAPMSSGGSTSSYGGYASGPSYSTPSYATPTSSNDVAEPLKSPYNHAASTAGFSDKRLNSYINAAARRRKAD